MRYAAALLASHQIALRKAALAVRLVYPSVEIVRIPGIFPTGGFGSGRHGRELALEQASPPRQVRGGFIQGNVRHNFADLLVPGPVSCLVLATAVVHPLAFGASRDVHVTQCRPFA